ncbi:hypothetical protein PRECH8_24750 [Insulibacter thermoxylanivorax]|uniref:O-antigen ligase-related domain-containing protein n=1 Tax=Insulibacter thermoxylanivorax TaxID=2749268 RepID=A0A916QGD9_9BACL|nr:O-antigen ligase family protein [Insulibacter thermoxylanivorax]GFR39179.1 hypothetical protein PRECH8_24750 [Insulibacter thermoxylanivorax]
MNYFLLIVLGAIMLFTPYLRGLFFDSDFYLVALVVMACFLVWLTASLITKKKLTGTYFTIFLVPFMFVLAFITAESPAHNFDNLFRWIAYACFFVMIVEMRKERKINKRLPYIFLVTGIAIAIFSYFGYLGGIPYKDIIVSDRLSGPFQYPNTFAAVMGAYWLYSLIMTIRTSLRAEPGAGKYLYSASLVLFGTTFFLAFSRGALIALPIAWFIGLVLLRTKEQFKYIIYTLLSGVLSILAMVMSDGQAWLALLVLIASSAVPAVVELFWSKRDTSDSLKHAQLDRHGRWLIPAVILVVGVLLVLDLFNQGLVYRVLPASMQQMVSNINLETGSALGRMGMYDDAWEISLDYPILGAGGEGWRVLYGQYQTEPYLSNEIHNGYLEMLLNIGFLGFAVFLLVFGFFAVILFRERSGKEFNAEKIAVTAAISGLAIIFIHAFLDFDFSYGTFWFIALWLLAMSVPVEGLRWTRAAQLMNKLGKAGPIAGKAAVTLFVLVVFIFNIRVMAASSQTKISSAMSVDQVVDRFESAHALNPYNVNYGISLASIYTQFYMYTGDEAIKQQVVEVLDKVVRMEPNNAKVKYSAGEMYLRLGDWERAVAYMDEALSMERFNVQFYNGLIPLKQQLGQIHADDEMLSKQYYQAAIDDYEKYLAWYEEFRDVYIPDKRTITITREAHIAAAKSYAELGFPEQAMAILQPFHPVLDEGIWDTETEQLLVDTFDILTLPQVLQQYNDRVMILSVRGSATRRISEEALEILKGMNSSIELVEDHGSYIAVIYEGKIIEEYMNNSGDVTLTHEQANAAFKKLIGSRRVEIYSAGKEFGDRSSIKIDGIEYSRNKRGLNIAVFDKEMTVIGTEYFDTHVSDVRVTK